MLIFTSCTKSNETYRTPFYDFALPVNVVDTLKGKEFRFDNLIWHSIARGEITDNAFISINDRPDIFTYAGDIEVSLMQDSSLGWVPVRKSAAELPYYGFLYGIIITYHPSNGTRNFILFIQTGLADVSLAGKNVSVSVKFQNANTKLDLENNLTGFLTSAFLSFPTKRKNHVKYAGKITNNKHEIVKKFVVY